MVAAGDCRERARKGGRAEQPPLVGWRQRGSGVSTEGARRAAGEPVAGPRGRQKVNARDAQLVGRGRGRGER